MYTLSYAIGRTGKRWSRVDIGDTALHLVYTTYQKVYAILTNPFITGEVCLDLDNYRSSWAGLNTSLNDFLTSNGSSTISNVSTTIPKITTRYVQYNDVFKAEYKVQPAGLLVSPDADISEGDKTACFLSNSDVDFSLFAKYCMVSVNGYFHFVDANSTGAWVHDGMVTRNKSLQNQMGVYGFAKIGQITHKKITSDMIYKQSSDQSYKHRLFIDIGEDVNDKTVALVVGGYLHICDSKTFYQVGDTSICVDVENMPLLDRYYESCGALDLSSLPLEFSSYNDSQFALDNFYSDENLVAYFTLPQSFIVLIDNDEVFVDKEFVRNTKLPGMYTSYIIPTFPLINGVGKVDEYWATEEDGQWALSVRDNFRSNRIYDTTDTMELTTVSDARKIENPGKFSNAYFLLIGSDLV